MTQNPPILLVEDDPSHVLLVRRFLAKGNLVNPVHAVSDGAVALAYLDGDGAFDDRARYPLPAALITDLNLAGVGGLELLEQVRARREYDDIPVVVMSGSTEGRDIEQVHELGAAAYLLKPIAFEALIDVLHDLGLPWALQRPREDDGT